MTPSVLRDTFAARYLEAGGTLEGLCEALGLTDVGALKRYERLSVQGHEIEPPPTPSAGEQPSRQEHTHQHCRRHRRKSSRGAGSSSQQQGAGGPDGSAEKVSIRESKEDP